MYNPWLSLGLKAWQIGLEAQGASVSTPVPRRHCNVDEDERIHRLSFRRADGEARQRSPDIGAQTHRFCARWTAFALPGYRDYSAR
jgi:hypothetical protein